MSKQERIEALENRFAELHGENAALIGCGRANVSHIKKINDEMRKTFEELQSLKKPNLRLV
jgi:hypothetical protein